MVCVWEGMLDWVIVALELPPVFPTVWNRESPEFIPTACRPLKFGKLNVEVPFPVPYNVPIVANKLAYVVRLIAVPSHNNQPDGAALPAYCVIVPVGSRMDIGTVLLLDHKAVLLADVTRDTCEAT